MRYARRASTRDLLGVRAGSTVLINGAAGGVGVSATQFARERGASVVGTASLPDLIELAGGPGNVVTIADFAAHGLGVRLSPGPGEGRAFHALGQAAALFADGRFVMPVRTFPLAQAAEAHVASQDGHVRGKLVLTVD